MNKIMSAMVFELKEYHEKHLYRFWYSCVAMITFIFSLCYALLIHHHEVIATIMGVFLLVISPFVMVIMKDGYQLRYQSHYLMNPMERFAVFMHVITHVWMVVISVILISVFVFIFFGLLSLIWTFIIGFALLGFGFYLFDQ